MRRRRRRKQIRLLALLAIALGVAGVVWISTGRSSDAGGVEPATIAAERETEPETRVAAATSQAETPRPSRPLPEADRPVSRPSTTRTPDPASVVTMGRSPAAEPTPRQTAPAASEPERRPEQRPQQQSSRPTERSEPAPAQSTIAASPERSTRTTATTSAAPVREMIRQAADMAARNRPVQAREIYNRALLDQRTTHSDRAMIRERMAELNETLIFSPTVVDGDAFTERYRVQSGDTLVRIVNRQKLAIDWRLLQRVNRMDNPSRLRVDQSLKIVRGPFHAVVSKSEFRMDVYAGPVPEVDARGRIVNSGHAPTFIRSFPVGLGEYGSTPVGAWLVRPNNKVINPAWTNPRTNESFAANDPNNPIGDRWIGLDGIDENTRSLSGYGIHGTIEPDSIGREMSMGCIRLLDGDVELIYELLAEGESIVHVVP